MNKLVLKSENAIEAQENINKIGKSLVDFFKNACVRRSITLKNMEYYYSTEKARRDGYTAMNDSDYTQYPSKESAHIIFSEQPDLILTKLMNNEFAFTETHHEKTMDELSSSERKAKFWKGKKFYRTKRKWELKSTNPSCTISHGDIHLEITKAQFDILIHFFKEQKETKRMNIEIESLSSRLDSFGINNTLK